MATPITIFSCHPDPAGVARRLRELFPAVQFDGSESNWSQATIVFRSWWKKLTLTITHDPSYYAEPGWSQQIDGMRGYFSGFPASENKNRAMMVISTFRFALGTLTEPDIADDRDPRVAVIAAVAEFLDGVLFTPSSLLDAHGRTLFSADGADDPTAQWPKVMATVDLSETASTDDEYEEPPSPSAERVARRALSLAAVTARAILEQDSTQETAHETYRDLLAWIDATGIGHELEPEEWKAIQRPLGKLEPRSVINGSWRLEGLAVLAWALELFQLPPHDELVDMNALWQSVGLLDAVRSQALLDAPKLRSDEELTLMRMRLLAFHWRFRQFGLQPAAMDFAEFAEKCWFGPLDIIGWPLVDGDIGLGGHRIEKASREALGKAQSAAMERHLAINWLRWGTERYSDTDTST